MTLAVALFGLFVAVLGVAGVVAPDRLLGIVEHWQRRLGLGFLAVLRVLIGVALFVAAPDSRAPRTLQVLGVLSALSGVATPFFGPRVFDAVLAFWRARSALFVRAWSAFVALFGAALVWSVLPAAGSG